VLITGYPQLRIVSARQNPSAEKQRLRRDQRVVRRFDRRMTCGRVCLSEASRGLSEQIRLRQRAERRSRYQRREVRTAFNTQRSPHGDEPQPSLRQNDIRQSKKFAASQQVRAVDAIGLNCSATQAVERTGIVRTCRIATRIGLVLTRSSCRIRRAAITTRSTRCNTQRRADTPTLPAIEERTGQRLGQHHKCEENAGSHRV